MSAAEGIGEKMLRYALEYAALGWPVFPVHYVDASGNCSCGNQCKPNSRGKHPATINGFKSATTNPNVIKNWWALPYNIGTTAPCSDGNNTLDIDPRNGGDITLEAWTTKHGNLPDTVTAQTGGGGLHYVFRVPEGRKLRQGKGVDVKADGGYIVVEPSRHASGNTYGWVDQCDPLDGAKIAQAPEWLLQPVSQYVEPVQNIATQQDRIEPSVIASLRQAFAYIPMDGYENWLQVGQALHAEHSGEQGFGLWIEASRHSANFDVDECRRKWKTFTNDKGLTIRSIFKLAQDHGWYNTGNGDPAKQDLPPKTAFDPVPIVHDFLSIVDGIPKRKWLVKSHLLRGYVSATFAPGGVGKSMFQLVQAVCVASGIDLLGLGVDERANVLVINNEDDYDEMFRRLSAILEHFKVPASELAGRLYMLSGYGQPFTIANRLPDGTVIASPESATLIEFVEQNSIGLICLDPFISTHSSEENANTEINQVISQYKRIAHQTRCAISLIHHTAKGGSDSEAHAGDANSGRGASALKDAARCVDTLAKMSKETAKRLGVPLSERPRYVRLDNGKLNFALSLGDAVWYYMHTVQIANGDYVGVPAPADLEEQIEKAEEKVGQTRWTAIKVAEALHNIIPIGTNEISFSEIAGRFRAENKIARSQAYECATMISNNENLPTRIKVAKVHWDYWYSKAHKTAPVVINRVEFG